MKILLLFPPYALSSQISGKKEWDKVIPRIHPLGIGYLAAYLLKHGQEVVVVDANCERLELSDIVKRLYRYSPDVVGITTTTPTFKTVRLIANEIRRNFPDTKIIIGGAHVTATPETTILHDCFDYGVIGEGEETLLELIKFINNPKNKSIDDIAGLVYVKEGRVIKTKQRGFINDLDQLPFPARQLMVPLSKTQAVPASVYKLPSGNMITSRGCPTRCTFCDRAIFGEKFRARSVDNILDEMEVLINEYGARDIKFYDDTFTATKSRVYKILDEMRKRRINVKWSCLTKVKAVDKELLKYMKECGCWQVLYGLESGDDRMLILLKKGNTVEDNRKAVMWAAELGMSTRGDFVLGTPGETKESLNNTLSFALSIPLDYAHFNKFVPFPGTEIYHNLMQQGYKFDDALTEGSSIDFFNVEFVPEGLDKHYYENFLREAHRRFYFRPGYLLKRLSKLRTFDQFKVQMSGFHALLKT